MQKSPPEAGRWLAVSAIGANQDGLALDLVRSIQERGCTILDSRIVPLGRSLSDSFLVSGNWSALNEAVFTPDIPLRVSELMYHPTDPVLPSPYDDDDFEFLELTNTGTASIDLTGVRLSEGVSFTFGSGSLAPNGYVLAVRNQAAFESRYGTGQPIAGQYDGKLANEGERIRLESAAGEYFKTPHRLHRTHQLAFQSHLSGGNIGIHLRLGADDKQLRRFDLTGKMAVDFYRQVIAQLAGDR